MDIRLYITENPYWVLDKNKIETKSVEKYGKKYLLVEKENATEDDIQYIFSCITVEGPRSYQHIMKTTAIMFLRSDNATKAKKVHYRHYEEIMGDDFIEFEIDIYNEGAEREGFFYSGYHDSEIVLKDGLWIPVK